MKQNFSPGLGVSCVWGPVSEWPRQRGGAALGGSSSSTPPHAYHFRFGDLLTLSSLQLFISQSSKFFVFEILSS